MIKSVKITDNTNTPVNYAYVLPAFANGKEYTFSNRVNIIVGENGCGKTTLLKMIRAYLMVYQDECGKGVYNSVLHTVFDWTCDKMNDGVDVYADYRLNTFSMFAADDRHPDVAMESFERFGQAYELSCSSRGQKTTYVLCTLFEKMFSKNANLTFNYESVFGDCPQYIEYVKKHRVLDSENTWTVLMDEPDNSVDIEHIMQLYDVFSEPKDNTQVIAVIHNPFLIAKLSAVKSVNIIEMSDGYVDKIKRAVSRFKNM